MKHNFALSMKKLFYSLFVLNYFFCCVFASQQDSTQEDIVSSTNSYEFLQLFASLPSFQHATIDLPVSIDKNIEISFDPAQGQFIVHYQMDGAPVGHLIKTDSMMQFQAYETAKPYNFSLINPVQTDILEIKTSGTFNIQQPVVTGNALLACKAVIFSDKFLAQQGLSVHADVCDNDGHVSCCDFLYQGPCFNALSDSILNIKNTAYFPALKSFFNDGKFSSVNAAMITTDTLENYGDLQVGKLAIVAKDIINAADGTIDIAESFALECDVIDNQNIINIAHDCFFSQVGLCT